MDRRSQIYPAQTVPIYVGDMLRVTYGANMGDGLSFLSDIEMNDVYELSAQAKRERLSFQLQTDGGYCIAQGSDLGRPGAPLHLDCALLMMAPDGSECEILVLVETDDEGGVDQVYFLTLSPLEPDTEYTLVGADRDSAAERFAQMACVSFSRGTRITLASGEMRAIEQIQIGDRILTRDAGPQEVRWIGQSTVRAVGYFAPILIKAGALNNEQDLVVSPDHRLFVYQRTDRIGVGQSEILVRARHLVNGDTVIRQDGGFVDYFQILFDRHHIIYAEGISAESMLIDGRTRSALPQDVIQEMSSSLPDHGHRNQHGLTVNKTLLDRPDAIHLLKRASTR